MYVYYDITGSVFYKTERKTTVTIASPVCRNVTFFLFQAINKETALTRVIWRKLSALLESSYLSRGRDDKIPIHPKTEASTYHLIYLIQLVSVIVYLLKH